MLNQPPSSSGGEGGEALFMKGLERRGAKQRAFATNNTVSVSILSLPFLALDSRALGIGEAKASYRLV